MHQKYFMFQEELFFSTFSTFSIKKFDIDFPDSLKKLLNGVIKRCYGVLTTMLLITFLHNFKHFQLAQLLLRIFMSSYVKCIYR